MIALSKKIPFFLGLLFFSLSLSSQDLRGKFQIAEKSMPDDLNIITLALYDVRLPLQISWHPGTACSFATVSPSFPNRKAVPQLRDTAFCLLTKARNKKQNLRSISYICAIANITCSGHKVKHITYSAICIN